jgi:hypothetical protein
MNNPVDSSLQQDTKFLVTSSAQSISLQKILVGMGKGWTNKYPEGILPSRDDSYRQVGIFVSGEGRGSLSQTSDIEYFHQRQAIELNTDQFIRQHTEGTPDEIFPHTSFNVDQLFEIYGKRNSIADVANEAIKQYILSKRKI